MKKSLYVLLALVIGLSASATTKTVGKTGAQYTSIQAAINSFTEAEVTDGQPDVVEIIDAAVYDEQIQIGNLVPDPESQSAGYLDKAIALSKRKDTFTLRGKDAVNHPKINPTTGLTKYGVFSDDPTDNYAATLSYLGKNIVVENVDILQSSVIADDQYGINGQAGNMVFKNVLFAHSGDTEQGEALINFNNSANNAASGFDNTYQFINCTFDSAVAGSRGTKDMFYFHGYTADDIANAGTVPESIPCKVTFDGCDFLNGNTVTVIRGRAQANNVEIKNSFVSQNAHGLRGAGKGTYLIENTIFYKNQNVEGDSASDFGSVETAGRDGYTPALTVKNCLFVDNLVPDAATLDGTKGISSRAGAIYITNDATENPDFTIANCTFVNSPFAIRVSDASGRERKGTVNNCVFEKVAGAVFSAEDSVASYLSAGTAVDVLQITGKGNVFDNTPVTVEYQELLPNVKIDGTKTAVTFKNPKVDPADPFVGPPYQVVTPTGVGANFAGTSVADFMVY